MQHIFMLKSVEEIRQVLFDKGNVYSITYLLNCKCDLLIHYIFIRYSMYVDHISLVYTFNIISAWSVLRLILLMHIYCLNQIFGTTIPT